MKTVNYLLLAALTGIIPLTATGNGPATRPPVPKRAAPLFIALLPPPNGPLLSQVPALPSSGLTDRPVRDIALLLSQLPAVGPVDLGLLKPGSGTQPRYVAVGGSLTAGFRNGGLYREAQLTAYPNLIARQMGLTDFRQPLFSPEQGNGAGYKQLVAGGAFVQYTDVGNNLATVGNDPLTFGPVSGRVDNLGMPFLGVATAYATEEWRYDTRLISGVAYELAFRSYFRRLLPNTNQQWTTTYLAYAKAQAADVCTVELGLDDLIWYASSGGYRLDGVLARIGMPEGNPVEALLTNLAKKGTKAVICTVPDVLRFPYFSFFTVAKLKQLTGGKPLYVVDNDVYDIEPGNQQHVIPLTDDALLLPSATVVGLYTGNTATGFAKATPLSSRDVLTKREISLIRSGGGLNDIIRWAATQNKIPVLDLRAIYDQILNGTYVTHDGLKIDPSFPGGNFFSADGLYPTPLGQAVIANEWIKTINASYGTRISLIATRQFADLLPR